MKLLVIGLPQKPMTVAMLSPFRCELAAIWVANSQNPTNSGFTSFYELWDELEAVLKRGLPFTVRLWWRESFYLTVVPFTAVEGVLFDEYAMENDR